MRALFLCRPFRSHTSLLAPFRPQCTFQHVSKASVHHGLHTNTNSHADSLSSALYRDILQRLEPTLCQYQQCDLLDLSPTGGKWSRHLINALNPRRYISIDSQSESASLDTPPAQDVGDPLPRFHTTSLKDCLDPKKALLSPDTLASVDTTFTKPTKSLFISAHLSSAGLSNSKYQGSAVQYFFNDLYASMFGLGTGVFRYGLAPVLAWLPLHLIRVVIPQGVDARKKLSLRLEAAFEISLIASPFSHLQDRRWPDLDVENTNALLSPHPKSPNHRNSLPSSPILPSTLPHPPFLEPAQYAIGAGAIEEWLTLATRLSHSHPDWFESSAYEKKPARATSPAETPEMKAGRACYSRAKAIHNRHQRIASIIKTQRELDARYKAYAASDHAGNNDTMQRFSGEAAELKLLVTSLSKDGQKTAKKAIDDYRAYDSSPRALEWNKRAVDPLVMEIDESLALNPLALVVLTPRSSFRRMLDTDDKVTCFEYVLNQMSSRWSYSVYEGLSRLLQGGVDEFIETVPSLKDPIQGGWLDLNDLRVRSLPASTFVDIGLAYERWPLRPDTTKLMFEMSSESAFSPST